MKKLVNMGLLLFFITNNLEAVKYSRKNMIEEYLQTFLLRKNLPPVLSPIILGSLSLATWGLDGICAFTLENILFEIHHNFDNQEYDGKYVSRAMLISTSTACLTLLGIISTIITVKKVKDFRKKRNNQGLVTSTDQGLSPFQDSV